VEAYRLGRGLSEKAGIVTQQERIARGLERLLELKETLILLYDRRETEREQEYDASDFSESEERWVKAFRDQAQ
jgi:hypothetical protein